MTELFAIRHGETEWNIQRRFQGQLNSPLTDRGRAKTIEKQPEVELLHPDVLYCSDLPRAVETAELLFPGLVPEHTPLLRELAMGVLEGVFIDEPGAHAELARTLLYEPEAYVPSEGAESVEQLFSRAEAFLAMVAERHLGQRVAAVSHGAAIRAMWTVTAGQPAASFWQAPPVHNLERMHFVYDGAWQYLTEGEG